MMSYGKEIGYRIRPNCIAVMTLNAKFYPSYMLMPSLLSLDIGAHTLEISSHEIIRIARSF